MYYGYAILAVLLILGDQLTKLAVRTGIPLGGSIPFIPGILDLTYVQNTGAAFSLLRQHTWLLTLTSALVVLVMCALIVKGFFQNALGRWAAALVLAGGVGNLIDRVRLGYVVDMFNFQFMRYPVFNVADICIVSGCILGLIYYQWFYEKHDKRGKSDGNADAPSRGI